MVDKAAGLYERALAVQPLHVPALCNYAALMSQVSTNLGKAIELYGRAVALEPNDPTVLCNLGNLKRDKNEDIEGAERLYKRALSLDPGHIQVPSFPETLFLSVSCCDVRAVCSQRTTVLLLTQVSADRVAALETLRYAATHCNALQRTATHCNAL